MALNYLPRGYGSLCWQAENQTMESEGAGGVKAKVKQSFFESCYLGTPLRWCQPLVAKSMAMVVDIAA